MSRPTKKGRAAGLRTDGRGGGVRQHINVGRYLPHAISATFAVVVLPALVVLGALPIFRPESPLLFSAILGISIALIAALAGSSLWQRRVDSMEVSFGELMLWAWFRRKKAEDRIAQGAYLLGMDGSGGLTREGGLSRERKLDLLYELTSALEIKDPYTHRHSLRVRRHSIAMGIRLGLSETEIEGLEKAAVLHDVGKIRLADRILRKPAELSEQELAMIREHVEIGARMVALVDGAAVVDGVRHHHERWDGSGYPEGRAGTDIPLFARIIAVADAYDAMTSTRPYRDGFARRRAVESVEAGAGTQFDPTVVTAFIATLPERSSDAWTVLALPQALWRKIQTWGKKRSAPGLGFAMLIAALFAVTSGATWPTFGQQPIGEAGAAPASRSLQPVSSEDRTAAEPSSGMECGFLRPLARRTINTISTGRAAHGRNSSSRFLVVAGALPAGNLATGVALAETAENLALRRGIDGITGVVQRSQRCRGTTTRAVADLENGSFGGPSSPAAPGEDTSKARPTYGLGMTIDRPGLLGVAPDRGAIVDSEASVAGCVRRLQRKTGKTRAELEELCR